MPVSFNLRKLSLQKFRTSSGNLESLKDSNRHESRTNLLSDALLNPQSLQLGYHDEGPISNVRKLLHSSADKEISPMLYCELLYLQMGANQSDLMLEDRLSPAWKQAARWIHYEQTIEGQGTRFSKPHLTFISLQSLLQLRNSFKKGVVLLDDANQNLTTLLETIQKAWVEKGVLSEDRVNFVKMILSAPKLHLVNGRLRRADDLLSGDKHNNQLHKKLHGLIPSSDDINSSDELKIEDPDENLLKKLAPGTESCAILVADLQGIQQPLSAFVRLKDNQLFFPDLPDHSIPVKFLFILLNNPSDMNSDETMNLGRTMGAVFSDEVFQKIAHNCEEKFTLSDAIDEFISQTVLIPPGKATLASRCHPEDLAIENSKEITRKRVNLLDNELSQPKGHKSEISISGRLFGGFREDINRKLPHYLSDFTDFFKGRFSQSIAAVIFLFFANLTNILAFGALMHKLFDGQVSAIENIVCAALSGLIFGLFSGQPLNILSATGPTLIFEKIIYDMCLQQGWTFLTFRFYMGCWICFFLILIVAKDLSAMVGFITRFTEEAFATLVSVVFIIQAVEKIWEIRINAPLTLEPENLLANPTCYCSSNGTRYLMSSSIEELNIQECNNMEGSLSGQACFFRPDVFLFSIILAVGTFSLAMYLHSFKHSPYLTSKIRNFVSDFGVLISIVAFTALAHIVGIRVDRLQVPDTLTPTIERSWIVDISDLSVYSALIAAIPALLYTILIVMDQQITAVIVNRKDNKLMKGGGYHLDLLIVALLVLICSLLGLPFYVAATVLSIAHLDSLRLQSDVSAPGDTPTFHGIKEQRLTTIISHILIGLSLFLTRYVRLVPTTVLIGIFLYMGVVSLSGQQFIQRLKLFLMPIKYQPDYKWLRSVRMKRVHLFTFIQLVSILALFGLKSINTVKILFPILLVFMVLTRALLLERLFTPIELLALDDRLLGWREIMRPVKKNTKNLNAKDIEASKDLETIPFNSD